ncbi:TPA: ComEC/Rec2 family competence protein [Klebsiella pneumoniae]|mgnify:CR=1 FL=1|uniref:ComEC/Rec2 family competence protein n=1 Tax=Enterobacterales TaxID=91347 RepID=UPI00107AE296|nr:MULTISPECIES: MBL fold metallo-hydrolase [Enterobacterales]VEW00918.1 putative metallo-beta-lactamase superfamily protein [Escherichia coli]
MNVFLNDAGNGDCIIVETPSTKIMIDGGTASSYKLWGCNLDRLSEIDALFVTHIDNDHVNGLICMFDKRCHPVIKEVFFNGIEQLTNSKLIEGSISHKESFTLDTMISNFSDLDEGGVDIGFSEGTSLSYLLKTLNYKINERFNGKAITTATVPNEFSIGDITIEIIGPTEQSIERIKESWLEVFSEYDLKMKGLHKKHSVAFERYIESLRHEFDYSDICEETGDSIEVLAGREFTDDNSLNNMSSISFLATSGGKKILFLADSDARTILEWMDRKGYETIEVDAVKLPHHGSKHNYNKNLLERVRCKKYLISTNGNKHSHPDVETLARIVRYSKIQPVDIYINHTIEHIDEKFKETFSSYSPESNIFFNEKEIFI